MFSAIFIDDELLIRKKIASIFLWLDEEIKLVGNFSNLSDTIAFLQDHTVDLIIADIQLKNESGMELAKYVHMNKLPTKVIILSAHQSFEYAKEGYKYNVFSYITKPLKIEELKEVLQELKNELRASRNSSQSFLDYVSDLIFESDEDSSADTASKNHCICQLSLTIKNYSDYDSNTLYQYISNILQLYNSELSYVLVRLEQDKAIAFVFSDNISESTNLQAAVEADISALRKIFLDTFQLHVDFGTYYLSVTNQPDSFQTEENSFAPTALYNDFILKSLAEHLLTNDPKKILPTLRSMISHLKTVEKKLDFANRLFEKLNFSFSLDGIPDHVDCDSYIIDTICKKAGEKNLTAHDSNEAICNEISSYIEQNFYRDISLYDIADHMNMNASYFSRYFKKLFDMNFSEYLVTFRINKAKEFLGKNNISIDAIANAVGYNHYQAFYKNFKRITGMTPHEYRTFQHSKEDSPDSNV